MTESERSELKQLITGILDDRLQETEDRMTENIQSFAKDISEQIKALDTRLQETEDRITENIQSFATDMSGQLTQVTRDINTLAENTGHERDRRGQLKKTA